MNDMACYTFRMNKAVKYGLWGFLFGTVGLYAIAMLSLLTPAIEFLATPLMNPGRWLASIIGGPDGTAGEVIILTLFNGVVYAFLFILIRIIAKKTTGA